MKKLESLEEFQARKWKRHQKMEDANSPHPNGIACPKCGKELWDSCPMLELTSYPPQKNIHCVDCSYKGYRLA